MTSPVDNNSIFVTAWGGIYVPPLAMAAYAAASSSVETPVLHPPIAYCGPNSSSYISKPKPSR